MTRFFLPMLPPTSTHQQVGHTIDKQGRHRFYQRGNGEAEAKLTAHLMKHIPEQPYSGAVRVVVKWWTIVNKVDRRREKNQKSSSN